MRLHPPHLCLCAWGLIKPVTRGEARPSLICTQARMWPRHLTTQCLHFASSHCQLWKLHWHFVAFAGSAHAPFPLQVRLGAPEIVATLSGRSSHPGRTPLRWPRSARCTSNAPGTWHRVIPALVCGHNPPLPVWNVFPVLQGTSCSLATTQPLNLSCDRNPAHHPELGPSAVSPWFQKLGERPGRAPPPCILLPHPHTNHRQHQPDE